MRTHAMRLAVVLLLLVLGGCPSSKNPTTTHDDAGTDAGSGSAAPACPIVPSCTTTIRYTGAAQTVIPRGDFAADGWTTGVPMQQANGAWEATIPACDQQVVLYKFVVDGTWIADPENPRKSPDGYGGFNSVVRVDCSHCPPRAAIDWRDAIMYFVMVDRFYDGDPSNDAPVAGVESPGNYQGGDFVGLQQKIEAGYFDKLGINTIWITSPLDNADGANPGADGHAYSGYHGYWPKDLTQ